MADDDFNEQDFYEHAKRAEAWFANDVSRRHHRMALKDFLHWMDRSGSSTKEGQTPGAKAAALAAVPSNSKELEGRLKIVDDRSPTRSDPVPTKDQPSDFASASEKAHDIFMNAVSGSKSND